MFMTHFTILVTQSALMYIFYVPLFVTLRRHRSSPARDLIQGRDRLDEAVRRVAKSMIIFPIFYLIHTGPISWVSLLAGAVVSLLALGASSLTHLFSFRL